MTTNYSLTLSPGYACWVSADNLNDYVHVKFTTELYGEDVKYKTIQKTFDLFLYHDEVEKLIECLKDSLINHTTQEKHNERT